MLFCVTNVQVFNIKNSGNQPEFHHQSKNEQFSFSPKRKLNTVVAVIRSYPKYVFNILLREVCFNLLIAFSLI